MNYESGFPTSGPSLQPPAGDEKTLALLSHILTFVAPLLAPLIIYLVKKDESAFIAAHAKESLNFPDKYLDLCNCTMPVNCRHTATVGGRYCSFHIGYTCYYKGGRGAII